MSQWIKPKLDRTFAQAIVAIQKRAENNDQQAILWLSVLSNNSYAQLRDMLKPFVGVPEFDHIVGQFLNEDRREWVETLLKEAKKAVKQA